MPWAVQPFDNLEQTRPRVPDEIRLRDVSIVVVGTGPVAARLVQRRRAAGGRVCWLYTKATPLRSSAWTPLAPPALAGATLPDGQTAPRDGAAPAAWGKQTLAGAMGDDPTVRAQGWTPQAWQTLTGAVCDDPEAWPHTLPQAVRMQARPALDDSEASATPVESIHDDLSSSSEPPADLGAEPAFDMATFAWTPPRVQECDDAVFYHLRKQLGTVVLDWRTSGPHLVRLQANEAYRIVEGGCGQAPGIDVVDAGQPDLPPKWAVSGVVICEGAGAAHAGAQMCPDGASADRTDVAVHFEEAKPFATVCPRDVGWWAPVYFLEYLLYHCLMAACEPALRPGDIPWWRGTFTVFIIGPVGFAAFPDFMGVALTGIPVPGLMPRLVGGATYLLGQVACAVTPFRWGDGKWYALPIFGAVSVAFLPYFLVTAPLHVWLTRPARASGLGNGRFPWVSHCLWLLWMVFGTFGTWLVLYGVSLAFVAMLKFSDVLASLALPVLSFAVELGTVCATVQLYEWLVYGPRSRAAETKQSGPAMLGDQRELLILPISITHAYAEGCRLVSLLASTVTHPSWLWVPQMLGCFLLNVILRSTLLTEVLSHVLPIRWRPLFAPDAGTSLLNEAKLCFGYPRFISLAGLAMANLIRHGWSRWPLFNMHATLLVACAALMEVLEDLVVTGNLAAAMTWRRRMASYYRARAALGTAQIMGFDREGVQSSGPAIGFSGMRFVRFRVVVVAVAASSFFPYTLLTLLLGAGFVHGACESPIGEESRILDGIIWRTPLRC